MCYWAHCHHCYYLCPRLNFSELGWRPLASPAAIAWLFFKSCGSFGDYRKDVLVRKLMGFYRTVVEYAAAMWCDEMLCDVLTRLTLTLVALCQLWAFRHQSFAFTDTLALCPQRPQQWLCASHQKALKAIIRLPSYASLIFWSHLAIPQRAANHRIGRHLDQTVWTYYYSVYSHTTKNQSLRYNNNEVWLTQMIR